MYSHAGERYYVVDSHMHLWDARPENHLNRHAESFIGCFYDFHVATSPHEWQWTLDEFRYVTEERLAADLFDLGHVDVGMFQPTYLRDFYANGFSTTDWAAEAAGRQPGRLIANGRFDPRDGDAGLRELERLAAEHRIQGVKLYTAEWKGSSRGWRLSSPDSYRFLEKCQELGVRNIHVHKGPTIRPLSADAFDVRDIDDPATDFPALNFIVEHVGLPRLDEFCWIADQEPNVFGGLAAAAPFIHVRPRYFAQILGELLWWIGEDRILFGSDYPISHPAWLVEGLAAFEFPPELQEEYGSFTAQAKHKILGLNAARLYALDVPSESTAVAPLPSEPSP